MPLEQGTKRMCGQARERDGLDYLEESIGKGRAAGSSLLSFLFELYKSIKEKIRLQHLHLDQPSFSILIHIFLLSFKGLFVESFRYDVCELAKHKHASFLISNKIMCSIYSFRVIHGDLQLLLTYLGVVGLFY